MGAPLTAPCRPFYGGHPRPPATIRATSQKERVTVVDRNSRRWNRFAVRVGAAVAAAVMLGMALFGMVAPVGAQTADAVEEVVAAVAELPELEALTPEETAQLQDGLGEALAAAIESDAAAGIERDLVVEEIVAAVQSVAAEADELNVDELIAAALDAYWRL